jgi:hypothetical protein
VKSGIGYLYIESHGGFYLAESDAYTKTLTTANTYYQLTGLNSGNTKNMTVNGTTGEITIKTPGIYHFAGFANINPNGSTVITFLMFVNGSSLVPAVGSKLSFLNSQAINSLSASGNIKFNRGDVITMRVKSSAATMDLSISNLSMSFHRIGSL